MDQEFRKRLAAVVISMRGDRSQREFAQLLDVGQSTVQAWENGRNTPSLDNLEKLARLRGESPEQLLAFLYGRDWGDCPAPEEQVRGMNLDQLASLMQEMVWRITQLGTRRSS